MRRGHEDVKVIKKESLKKKKKRENMTDKIGKSIRRDQHLSLSVLRGHVTLTTFI